ncbi:MAG: hypothetical protein ACREFO_02440 [Acetobacteraceae bacterium]
MRDSTRAAITRQIPIDAPLRVLLIDRTRADWRERLTGRLGEDGARVALALGAHRYFFIGTLDTRGDPRYMHDVELLPDLGGITRRLLEFLASIDLLASACSPPVDINFCLQGAERDRVNAAIDAYEAERLRLIPARGAA